MKQYIINEEELIELLAAKIALSALEAAGVDNWWNYAENFWETKNDYLQENGIRLDYDEIYNMNFEDVAKYLLKDYTLINKNVEERK